MLSIICPVYNEERYIASCIDSIIAQEKMEYDYELILVDGYSIDRTRNIIAEYQAKYSQIRLIDNEKRHVAAALNLGIKAAKGDIIVRIDAHSVYPSNYISEVVKYHSLLNADNIGGVCYTLPADDSILSRAIAVALSHKFGVGNSFFRIGSKDIRKVDTVPFGCFSKKIFNQIGLYDEDMLCNEDDELNGRIIKKGGSIYLVPHIVIQYYARDSISKLWKMFYQYGLFKPLVNKKIGSPSTVRQFFPILFLLGIIIGFLLSLINHFFAVIYIMVMSLYWGIAFYFSLREIKKMKNWRLIYLLPIIFFSIHVSYGGGYLRGIYNILVGHPFSAKVNR